MPVTWSKHMDQSVPYLEFCGISKEFPGVKALQNVSFPVTGAQCMR